VAGVSVLRPGVSQTDKKCHGLSGL
jgi:hypothetical protein